MNDEQLKRIDTAGITGNEAINQKEGNYGSPPTWPVKTTISSKYGWRKDPINGQSKFHFGVDLPADEGTLIKASLPGKVITSEFRQGYGNLVVLEHGQGLKTLYAHNSMNLVNSGDWVKGGTPLGKVGSSGRSTGPHLHFEVRRNGQHLDPLGFLGSDPNL